MSVTVTLTLDDETHAYLKRIAADQGRTPAEVASWILTDDLRRERAVDADLLTRLGDVVAGVCQRPAASPSSSEELARRERAGA